MGPPPHWLNRIVEYDAIGVTVGKQLNTLRRWGRDTPAANYIHATLTTRADLPIVTEAAAGR